MPVFFFSSGGVWVQRTDIALATPMKVGELQDISVDFQTTMKELYGENQYPVAVAAAEGKISGKAKMGRFQARLLADLWLGTTITTGYAIIADGEAMTVPAATPYTASVANAANFKADLGVVYAATGLPLTLVAANPAQGQYGFDATGKYTFAAADAGAALKTSYSYANPTAGGTISAGNPLQGIQPAFKLQLQGGYTGSSGVKRMMLTLYASRFSKFSVPTKKGDFAIPELDFSAFADDAGNTFDWAFSEVS